jgi:multidrug transporter EmrE-like cation transporter
MISAKKVFKVCTFALVSASISFALLAAGIEKARIAVAGSVLVGFAAVAVGFVGLMLGKLKNDLR